MGLFSSSYKIQVATSVTRVVSDKLLPNAVQVGAVKALFAEGDIASYVMEEMVSSIGLKAEGMFHYGETDYVYGSPSGDVFSTTQSRLAVEKVLQATVGKTLSLEYCHYGPPNLIHLAWMRLINEQSYNPTTNQLMSLSAQKNTPVYLIDMEVSIPSSDLAKYANGSLDQYSSPASTGILPTADFLSQDTRKLTLNPYVIEQPSNTEVTVPTVRLTYTWVSAVTTGYGHDSGPDIKTYSQADLTFTFPALDVNLDFFHAKYTLANQTYYWMYQVGVGTYPSLDALFDVPAETDGQFFPISHFRQNNKPVHTDTVSEAYLSSKRLMKHLGMDYSEVSDAINTNKDINQVEQAMMIMAVPANSTNPIEQTYLFDFFDNWFYNAPPEAAPDLMGLGKLTRSLASTTKNAFVIKDKLFKMVLNCDNISKSTKLGNLGKVGTVVSGTYTTTTSEQYMAGNPFRGGMLLNREVPHVYHFYRKQVSELTYQEILVLELRMVYYIFEGYVDIGEGTEGILLIPLDHSITKKYKVTDREILYARSLHFIFNSKTVTEIKWYQSGFFQFLMIVIAVVIFVYTWDPELTMQWIAFTSGTMTLVEFAYVMATMLLIPYVITTVAIKYFIQVVGGDLALLVAVVATAYGLYKAHDFMKDFGGTLVQALKGAPWAQDLLTLSSNLVSGVNTAAALDMQELQSEASEFTAYINKELKSLETSKELLDKGNTLTTLFIPGEIPSEFFARTKHQAGNIGRLGIDAIGSYVNIALTLPKLANTPGEFNYAH